jgi:hypothetical protein
MHDDRLEQRLRAALRAGADDLSFTITAEELQRRLVIRRRARLGRPGTLLLTATVGIGLVGFGLLAGGWLERPQPNPSPVPSAPIAEASQETPTPSSLPLPPSLPSLEAFLAPLDPARIVRAQSVGLSTAPTVWSRQITGPGSTMFAPVTRAGSYRVWLACLGSDGVTLDAVRANPEDPAQSIPITCNGATTARDIGLAAGDALSLATTAPTSWRIAVLAPDRAPPHAESIAKDVTAAAGRRLDGQAASERATPDYGLTAITATSLPVTSLSFRDAFRIAVSCAGPGPLTYRLVAPLNVLPAGDDWALNDVATTVECDGGTHVDVVRFPFSTGADVWIEAPEGTAWRLAAAFEGPPIQAPKDGGGWTLGVGLGPNLIFDPQPDTGEVGLAASNRIRVVVTCLGGTGVDIVVREKVTGAATTGTASCEPGRTTVTVIPVAAPGRDFFVESDPHGAMWLAVTIQQADPRVPGG